MSKSWTDTATYILGRSVLSARDWEMAGLEIDEDKLVIVSNERNGIFKILKKVEVIRNDRKRTP